MAKTFRFFGFVSWAMIAVGVFSIVTGFFSLIGFSEAISDKIGDETLFNFINGGAYFMLCGAIHVVAGFLGLRRLTQNFKAYTCIIMGMFTLAWQLAAFIYLFTMQYISIRAALMVILPIIYLTAIILTELKVRLTPTNANGEENQTPAKKTFVVKHIFGNFNFSFKRKNLEIPVFGEKRKMRRFNGFQMQGKRRKQRRITMRKFTKR